MATNSPPLPPRKPILTRFFSGSAAASFLEARFLPSVLPVVLGMLMALLAALLIIRGQLLFLVPLVFLVPVAILLIRYPFAAVLVWLLLFPFFIRESIPGSRFMYLLLHRAMIPGALGIAVLSQLLPTRNTRRVRLGIGDLSLLLFLFLGISNILLLSSGLVFTLTRFYDRIFVPFCMYGLVRLTAPNEEDLKRIAWIAPVIVIVQSAIGFFSWYAPGLLPDIWLSRLGERTVGTFGNPGVFTTTLVFCSLFLIQYAVQSKSSWTRVVCFSLVGLAFFSIGFSFSRGSWLGLLFVIAGLVFLYPRVITRFAVVLIMLIVFVSLTFFSGYISFAWERLSDRDTAQGRIIGGAASLRLFEQKPLFGWGYNSHEFYDEQFRERVLGLAVNDQTASHNTYLLILAEMGITGFFLYMFPLLWWFLESRKAWPRMRMRTSGFHSRQMLAMLWLLMLDHILVNAFTDMFQSNLFARTMWWMTLGLIASLVSPYLAPGGRETARSTRKS